jgi:hypothetical protein
LTAEAGQPSADAASSGADARPGMGTSSSGGASGAVAVDAGAAAAGALPGIQYPDVPNLPAGSLGPSAIAIVPGGARAYISLSNASFIVSVGISSAGFVLPGNGVYLHEGALGSNRARLNVNPYRFLSSPGIAGVFVGAEIAATGETEGDLEQLPGVTNPSDRKYLYVIARDGRRAGV